MSRKDDDRYGFNTCGWIGIVFAAMVLVLALTFAIWVGMNLEFQN